VAKPEPKGLAIIVGARKPSSLSSKKEEGDEDAVADEGGSEQEYGRMLADMAGISEEDRPDFIDALKGFVKACSSKSESDEDY